MVIRTEVWSSWNSTRPQAERPLRHPLAGGPGAASRWVVAEVGYNLVSLWRHMDLCQNTEGRYADDGKGRCPA